MAETSYTITQKYRANQQWTVTPTDPSTLTPTIPVQGLNNLTYNLGPEVLIIHDVQNGGATVATIAQGPGEVKDIIYSADTD